MKVCIASDYQGLIESIVMADDMKLAHIYWQGAGVHAHSTREIDMEHMVHHPTGVLPILKTKEVIGRGIANNPTYRKVCKGVS